MPPCRGKTTAITAASGRLAMAARSLRLTARRLAADPPRIVAGQLEIDVVGEHVHGDDALVDPRHAQHGRIVARPQPQQRMGRQSLAQPGNQFSFHGTASMA